MHLAAVYHNPKSQYAYAYDRNTLHLRVRRRPGRDAGRRRSIQLEAPKRGSFGLGMGSRF